MDHLLQMKYAIYPEIEIPYLCDDCPYSNPFETFPERLSFTRSDLVDARCLNKSAIEVDKLLQAWLFFGLLETVFGSLFEREQFIRRNSADRRIISTQRLRRIMVYFLENKPDPYEPEWNTEWRRICQLLKQAKGIMMDREENCKAIRGLQTPTELLIAVTLQFLAKRLARDEVRNSNNFESGLIESLMLERGWCRRQVAYLTESLHVECLYLISRIERPDPQFRHSNACELDCVVNQVDRETYKSQHLCPDSSCGSVAADQAKMFAMLQAGHLPLVANRDYTKSDEIELLDTQRAHTYVAISHVWSHGLGNPKDNSLPSCQVARLDNMIRSLYPDRQELIPYWVDTICVPIVPAEARSLAIIKLRKTYKEADKVLVVDANLEKIDSSQLFVPEIALYITCSTWLTRLWTLQEGALAQSLYFKFADRIIDVVALERSLRYDKSLEEYGSLLGALFNYRHADQKDMGIPASGLIQFLHASVRNRSTSYASDEALCLATLAGLDMEEIARFTGEEDRMYQFWRLLRPTPSMMAFWTGPRFKTVGRRWAPATLRGNLKLKLDQRKASDEEGRGEEAIIAEAGMMLRAPGLLLDQLDQISLERGLLVRLDLEDKRFVVRRAGLLYEALFPSEVQCAPIREQTPCLALILKRGKRLGVSEYDQAAIDNPGVFVRIDDGRPGQLLYSRIISNVSVDRVDFDGLAEPGVPMFAGVMLPDSQEWCLG